MKKALILFAIFIISTACKKDKSFDPKLAGKWSDDNALYSFNSDFSYYIKYLRPGKGIDTVTVDSIYGTFELERTKKENKLTFNQQGYREKFTGLLKPLSKKAGVWEYTFENDSTLRYTSYTSTGILYRE